MAVKNSVSVSLEHITKVYKNTKGRPDVVAVHESNFEVKAGDLVRGCI